METPSNCYSFQWESAPAKSRWNLSPNWGCFQILKMTDQPFVGPLESIEQCRASPSASERCRERRTFRGLCGVRSRMSRVEAVPVLLKSIGLQLRVAIVWLSMKMCQSTAARLPQRDCAIVLFFFPQIIRSIFGWVGIPMAIPCYSLHAGTRFTYFSIKCTEHLPNLEVFAKSLGPVWSQRCGWRLHRSWASQGREVLG